MKTDMKKSIYDYIAENLREDMKQTALDFANYLQNNNVEFIKDNCYWKDKIYYLCKFKGEYVCFIAIKDPDEPDNYWTIWSEDSNAYEDVSADDSIKNAAWKHVDHCGNCGSCGGGKAKNIFGKVFNDVCGCTFRVDNATQNDLPFLEKMIELRIAEILSNINEIKLIKPTIQYAGDIMSFRDELFSVGEKDTFDGCGGLQNYTSAEEWLKHLSEMENESTCPAGKVTSDVYIAVRVSDNKVVGIIDLRHHINHPILSVWGGHIGYTVRPAERRKGYAKEMLRLNLQNCRSRGIDKILLTCSKNNIASEKTIIANGGVYENEVKVGDECVKRFWVEL